MDAKEENVEMKSQNVIKMAYATFILVLAVVFFTNAPKMKSTKTTWNNSFDPVRSLTSDTDDADSSEADQLAAKVKDLSDNVGKIQKAFADVQKNEDDLKKMKIKELQSLVKDLKEDFDLEEITALFKSFDELKGNEKVDQDKLPKQEDMDAIKVAEYIEKVEELISDKAIEIAKDVEKKEEEKEKEKEETVEERLTRLEKENKKLKKSLHAERCDNYETLSDLHSFLGRELKDKYGVIQEVQRESSPMDYMGFFMAQMFQRSMMTNSNPFALSYSPFSVELETIQRMRGFGFRAPSIFDYSDQIFSLPGISSFPNVSTDMDLSRSMRGLSGLGQNPLTINNNNYNFYGQDFANRMPSQATDFGATRGSMLQDMPQMIPQWNRGDGNVSIFSQRQSS